MPPTSCKVNAKYRFGRSYDVRQDTAVYGAWSATQQQHRGYDTKYKLNRADRQWR